MTRGAIYEYVNGSGEWLGQHFIFRELSENGHFAFFQVVEDFHSSGLLWAKGQEVQIGLDNVRLVPGSVCAGCDKEFHQVEADYLCLPCRLSIQPDRPENEPF